MANSETLREALMELRLSEEAEIRRRYRQLRKQLSAVRVKISAIEESITRCSRQAKIAFRNGNDTVGRGNRREVQGLTLLRARHIGELAGIKAELVSTRNQWAEARERRRGLTGGQGVLQMTRETMQGA